MDKGLICCVTGHRRIPADQSAFIKVALEKTVLAAVEQGYTHFISGFASGVDLMFAEVVADLKKDRPITLEAAIPCPGRMKTHDPSFQRLIGCCDVVKIHSYHYFKGCYEVRNRYMVDASSLVIAVWDGRETGGTAATVRYAERCNKDVAIIHLLPTKT